MKIFKWGKSEKPIKHYPKYLDKIYIRKGFYRGWEATLIDDYVGDEIMFYKVRLNDGKETWLTECQIS